jgi:hypothetical protein
MIHAHTEQESTADLSASLFYPPSFLPAGPVAGWRVGGLDPFMRSQIVILTQKISYINIDVDLRWNLM